MDNEYQRDQNLNSGLGGEPQRDLDAEQGTEKKGLFERAKEIFQKPGERHDQDVTQTPLTGGTRRDQDVSQAPLSGGMQRDQDVTQTPGVQSKPDITSGSAQRDVYEHDQDFNQSSRSGRDVTQNRDVSQTPWSGQQFDNQPEENYSEGTTQQTESGFDLIHDRDDMPRDTGAAGPEGMGANDPYTQRRAPGDITENRPPEAERHPNDLIDRAKDKLEGFFGNPDDPSPER